MPQEKKINSSLTDIVVEVFKIKTAAEDKQLMMQSEV